MIHSFKEAVLSMDYSWRDPKTYAVLIPFLSPVIHAIHSATLRPKLILNRPNKVELLQSLTEDPTFVDRLDFSHDEKLAKSRDYHFLAFLIREIALTVLVTMTMMGPNPHYLGISILFISLISDIAAMDHITKVLTLSRVQIPGSPTKVCFNFWSYTTLKPFLLQEEIRC